jgi:hypothetical protein
VAGPDGRITLPSKNTNELAFVIAGGTFRDAGTMRFCTAGAGGKGAVDLRTENLPKPKARKQREFLMGCSKR